MDVIIEGRIVNTSYFDSLEKITLIENNMILLKQYFFFSKTCSVFFMFLDLPRWLGLNESLWVSRTSPYQVALGAALTIKAAL